MRKLKKSIIGLALIAITIVGTCSITWAQATTSMYDSPSNTAGTWWSGYDKGQIVSITSTSSSIYGGDVGIYFYTSSVGMPEGFVRTTNRKTQIQLKEDDSALFNKNELVRKYEGYFGYDNAGRYRMISYPPTYTNSACIESNNVAELYLRINVGTVSGDTTKNVPKGLFRYRLWAN